MAPPPHLRIFGGLDTAPTPTIPAFDLFPTLPAELRIQIWLLTLQRQRIISVHLRSRSLMDLVLQAQGDARPRTRQDERYGAIVQAHQTISKLFRVNRESRGAALSFYRVPLPCWLTLGTTSDSTIKPAILYFNPELDFFRISSDTREAVDFIHDLKTVHDPRNVGLLNLAIDVNGLGGLYHISPWTLEPALKTSFAETLAQLREVFFVHEQVIGRHILGIRYGMPTEEYLLNRSFPIKALPLSFDRLHRDPRRIGQDLRRTFINTDPRGMILAWRRLIYNYLGQHVTLKTEHRLLLTMSPMGSPNIHNRQAAVECLQKQEDIWVKETLATGRPDRIPGETSEGIAETAFGFWLFPVDAFGALLEDPNGGFRPEPPRVFNLEEHWPELAFFTLY